MPYTLPKERVSTFFCPKSGGTSLRAYMFHLENGFAFREYMSQGRKMDANTLSRNEGFKQVDHEFIKDFDKFALIRDPVKRFLSGYSNRVIHYQELSREVAGEKLAKFALSPDPSLEVFIENFTKYCKASRSIGHHFTKQQVWLGTDISYYKKIFHVENVGEMTDYFAQKLNMKAAMPQFQSGGPKLEVGNLKAGLLDKILKIVGDDIAFEACKSYRSNYGLL